MPRKSVTTLSDPGALFDVPSMQDVFRLSFVANSITVPVYEQVAREFGLKRGEYLLLFCLSHVGALRAQDVAMVSGRPRNSISRAVKRMLADGFVKRCPDPHDGRQSVLSITASGRRLNGRIQPLFEARGRQVFSVLSERERSQLDHLLAKLTADRSRLGD